MKPPWPKDEPESQERAPLLGRWSLWYLLEILWLVVLGLLFYLFTRHFS